MNPGSDKLEINQCFLFNLLVSVMKYFKFSEVQPIVLSIENIMLTGPRKLVTTSVIEEGFP